ncbi:nimA protein [Deltaproteobacteria bacterium Smac51]|nr:nimA protein [Deltaproteobacteria bacterium Smac51]
MQHRMKTHPLTTEQIDELLIRALTGTLATINTDGSPYAAPIHFIYLDNAVYFHGLPKGSKIDNLKADPRVSMTVYEMESLLLAPDGQPCDTNTKYRSVILSGLASLVEDMGLKKEILSAIVKKYTPHLNSNAFPDNMVKGTAVIRIQINSLTGKYYD